MENRRPYDKFKKAIYEAEDSVMDRPNGRGKEFNSTIDALIWVAQIHSLDPLFKDRPFIGVKKAHGNAKASWADYKENSISLTDHGMCEQIVLHELAHLATDSNLSFHGPEFCWNYLDLTLRWRGPGIYYELRDAFKETGIFG